MSTTAPKVAPAEPPPAPVPWLGIVAVLLGTFISTLTSRISGFALADVRGAVHAGFDSGAWITTAQTTAQMLVTPVAVWAGGIYGPRAVLLRACLVFALSQALLPLSTGLTGVLIWQFIAGLGSGCFIPLTLSFLLLRMPRTRWSYAVAVYALNIELSIHVAASLEGWYVDHASWRWIFWQNVPLALGMAACLYYGVRVQPPRPEAHPRPDVFGLTAFGGGLALIYAALDQGNRLDWLHSGLVWGLLLAGLFLLVCFYAHVRQIPDYWLNLRVAQSHPLPLILVLIALLRSGVLATSFLVPQFLTVVRGFRALEVGDALVWVAIPQLVACPLSGYLLRRLDPRPGAALGFCCIGAACMLVAHGLTPQWGPREFLPSALLQALGQSLALTGVVYTAVLNLKLEHALTFGAMVQSARLFGGELGQAGVATFQRIREQRASNLIGLHVRAGDSHVIERLRLYGRVASRVHLDPGGAAATGQLARVVRTAATTQSVIDSYVALAAAAVLALLVLALLDAPPGAGSLLKGRKSS
jgi:DHA2 family multidrug resistance protein